VLTIVLTNPEATDAGAGEATDAGARDAAQDCGVRMPYGGPYLDQAHIDLIKTRIDEGAPND
jgi:hypothetical protein